MEFSVIQMVKIRKDISEFSALIDVINARLGMLENDPELWLTVSNQLKPAGSKAYRVRQRLLGRLP